MKPDLLIRPATTDEIAQVLALYRDSGLEQISFTESEALAHWDNLARVPGYSLFVAVAGETIVATYALLLMPNLAKRGKPSGIVENVAVAPAWQGRGVGRVLMRAATNSRSPAMQTAKAPTASMSRSDSSRMASVSWWIFPSRPANRPHPGQ
jgi:GNAT superfamily N-acetyltransferase